MKWYVLLLLPILSLFSEAKENDLKKCDQQAVPQWVKTYEISTKEVTVKQSQVNVQYLLIDRQRNWEEKTTYFHYAIKALDPHGVEKFSKFIIDFDPSYQKVMIHTVRLFRDGKWHDRLERSNYQVVQREQDLDQNVYNGRFTFVCFLDDVRQGDIVEYSYSVTGQNPTLPYFADFFYFQEEFSIEKMVYRFLAHPTFVLHEKTFNSTIKPQITDISPQLRAWTWEVSDTLPCKFERYTPWWYSADQHVQMSQYRDWQDLGEKIVPLFTLSSNFTQTCSAEMLSLVASWDKTFKDPKEKALQALRFVQDEIRYLGFENGVDAVQPRDPNLVLQRRFGDCKDKTLLLHAFLKLMHIYSAPVLVNSHIGKKLPKMLPALGLFKHVILQIEINGSTYLVDPTLSFQGGSLETNGIYPYYWGLLLSSKNQKLISLPNRSYTKPIEIESTYTIPSPDIVNCQVKITYHGLQADGKRAYVKQNGIKKISSLVLDDMKDIYEDAAMPSPVTILDDRENNVFTVTESYVMSATKFPDGRFLRLLSFAVKDYLHNNKTSSERIAPYALDYPFWIKEHVHVDNPLLKWNEDPKQLTLKHDSFFYTHLLTKEDHHADLYVEIKNLKDHVPINSLKEYCEIYKTIDNESYFKTPIYFFHINEPFPSYVIPILYFGMFILFRLASQSHYYLKRNRFVGLYRISNSEEKTKQKSFVVFCIYGLLETALFCYQGLLQKDPLLSSQFNSPILSLSILLGYIYVSYYCFYKRYGTILLSFQLLASPITSILNIIHQQSYCSWWLICVHSILLAWWYYWHTKVWKINQKMQTIGQDSYTIQQRTLFIFEYSQVVNMPPEHLWQIFIDFDNPLPSAAKKIAWTRLEGPLKVGSKIKVRPKIWFPITTNITKVEENVCLAYSTKRAAWQYNLAPLANSKTQCTLTMFIKTGSSRFQRAHFYNKILAFFKKNIEESEERFYSTNKLEP